MLRSLKLIKLPQITIILSIIGLLLIKVSPLHYKFYSPLMSIRQPGLIISDVVITKAVMASLVTVVVLISSLYVLLSKKYKEPDKRWAYGAIGTILGYWLS